MCGGYGLQVGNQPSGLFPVEETNQVIKMLSNYSTAAVTLLLAMGVDKGLQLGYTEI